MTRESGESSNKVKKRSERKSGSRG